MKIIKKTKRFLSAVLTLMLIFTLMPVQTASAANTLRKQTNFVRFIGNNQVWYLKTRLSDSTDTKNRGEALYLTYQDGRLQPQTFTGQANQKWRLVESGGVVRDSLGRPTGGDFVLQNLSNNAYLKVSGSGSGATYTLDSGTIGDNHKFKIEYMSGLANAYRICSKASNYSQSVNIYSNNNSPGAEVKQYANGTGNNSQFIIEPAIKLNILYDQAFLNYYASKGGFNQMKAEILAAVDPYVIGMYKNAGLVIEPNFNNTVYSHGFSNDPYGLIYSLVYNEVTDSGGQMYVCFQGFSHPDADGLGGFGAAVLNGANAALLYHELGHAINNIDHCSDPECAMGPMDAAANLNKNPYCDKDMLAKVAYAAIRAIQ